jgi:hypothetical protein
MIVARGHIGEWAMAEPEAMYPEIIDARATRSDWNGPLLVEMQTNGRPLRFAVTTANALRFAEWLAKAALDAQDLGSFAG